MLPKDIINVIVRQGNITALEADALVVNLFKDVTTPHGATGAVDKALNGAIGQLIGGGDIKGNLGEVAVLYPNGLIPARRVIIVGLGEQEAFDLEAIREAAAVAIKRGRDLGAKDVATIVHGGGVGGLDIADAAQATVEGSLLALYQYENPLKQAAGDKDTPGPETLQVIEFDAGKIGQIERGAEAGQIIANSANLARQWVNLPANLLTPTALAQAAKDMAEATGLAYRILEEEEMAELGMNALLSVAKSSHEPAKFIILEHKGSDKAPVILVGKGVTFDTGGYSIKSREGMVGMKADMGGAAAVIATMHAVALLDIPLHVIALVPCSENMINDQAYKPGDVFAAMNKVTIEIISTDAEGRMLLADALCYADTLKPAAVIDVATLTGGVGTALGKHYSGLFCNDEPLAKAIQRAGDITQERFWPLPNDKVYDRQIQSNVADVKNSGGRMGHATLGARFLAHFVGEWSWAHLDIAATATYKGGPEDPVKNYLNEGASGVPVRMLVHLLRNWP